MPTVSHSRLWRLTLVLFVALPFLPEIAIYVVAALAKIKGCNVDEKAVCVIGSVPMSDTIVPMSDTIVAALEPRRLLGCPNTVRAR
jgi:hypothetical protein